MSDKVASIARNTSYFTVALIIQKIISFSYFTLYARALEPQDLGKYYFAISFASIFAVFLDLGLANALTREIAKFPEQASKLVSNILGIKLPLIIFTGAVLIAAANFWHYSDLVRDLIYLAAAVMILDSFTSVFYAAARGFHNLKFESLAAVISQTIVLIYSLVALYYHWDLRLLMLSLVIASLFNCGYSAAINMIKWKLRLWPRWDLATIKTVLILTAPFGLYAVFQKIYTFADSVLLFRLAGDWAVGIYQVPFKIVMALQFLPAAFIASLYPALSRYWQTNREQLGITFQRAMNYSLIIAMPIMVGVISLADKIVLIFKSGYQAAVLPLQITMVALLFMFLTYPIGSLLNACDKQKQHTINMAITMIVSLILNLMLIPLWGVVGSSLALAISSAVLLFTSWYYVPQIIDYRLSKVIWMLGKTLLAAGLMGALVYSLRQQVNLFLLVTSGGVVYFLLLYWFKAFSKTDILSVLQTFKRKNEV